MDGILPFDKAPGISSARALNQIKPLLPRKTKIGHAGTLDTFATGLLILLVGKATKLCESMMDQPKQYEATVKLGATTVTDDPDSAEQACEVRAAPTVEQIRERRCAAFNMEPFSKLPRLGSCFENPGTTQLRYCPAGRLRGIETEARADRCDRVAGLRVAAGEDSSRLRARYVYPGAGARSRLGAWRRGISNAVAPDAHWSFRSGERGETGGFAAGRCRAIFATSGAGVSVFFPPPVLRGESGRGLVDRRNPLPSPPPEYRWRGNPELKADSR